MMHMVNSLIGNNWLAHMIADIFGRRQTKAPEEVVHNITANDANLEAAIENAGRARVFSIIQSHGWEAGTPLPKWMWWEAVRIANSAAERNKEALDRALLTKSS